jgi:hypothetical protein
MTNTTNTTKRQPVITTAINAAGRLFLMFPGLDKQLSVFPADLDPGIIEQATLHGLKQKLVDAAAISRDPDTGRSATAQDKYDAVKKVYDRITRADSPEWNEPREGGGNVGGLLLSALCRLQPSKDKATLKTWLDSKSDAEKAALRKNPKISAIIADIQAERAKADGIDTDELLGEIEGE